MNIFSCIYTQFTIILFSIKIIEERERDLEGMPKISMRLAMGSKKLERDFKATDDFRIFNVKVDPKIPEIKKVRLLKIFLQRPSDV